MAAQMIIDAQPLPESAPASVNEVLITLTEDLDTIQTENLNDKMIKVHTGHAPHYFSSEPPTGHQGKTKEEKSGSAKQAAKTRARNELLAPIVAEDALRLKIQHAEHVLCLETELSAQGYSDEQLRDILTKSKQRAESMATVRFHHRKLAEERALKLKKAIKKDATNAKQKTKRKAKSEAEQYAKAQKLIAEFDAKRAASAAAFEAAADAAM